MCYIHYTFCLIFYVTSQLFQFVSSHLWSFFVLVWFKENCFIGVNKYKIMSNSIQNQSSQQAIDTLFRSAYFISKFKQLQLKNYHELNQIGQETNAQKCKSLESSRGQKDQGESINLKNNKAQDLDNLTTEISDLILASFKEIVYKETNIIYENKLNLINITEEIQNIKQSISKMGQATSFAISSKTLAATHESMTPDPKPNRQKKQNQLISEEYRAGQASLFMYGDQESSIDLGISRKNLTEDRVGNFSFMNSFLNQNKITAQQQEIINQRINASISKIQSSIDDRISQLEKEFTRRIQQVMKTMGHFIQMINDNDRFSQSPFNKNKNKDFSKGQPFTEGRAKRPEQNPKLVSSKSTIILPQNKKCEIDNAQAEMNKANLQKQQNRSGKLASFFGLGRMKTQN